VYACKQLSYSSFLIANLFLLSLSIIKRGDYLIVGIHGDAVVNRLRGMNMPLMNLHERVLSVLGCDFVDDILIDAPYEITPDMITRLNITEVVCGTKHDDIGVRYVENMYAYPKKIGILTVIESPSAFNLANIFDRIRQNQEAFQAKFDRKMKAEAELNEQNGASNNHNE
jgi:ethanolamine-phosphate cytidylyltransferase